MTIGTKNLSRRATLAGPPAIAATAPNSVFAVIEHYKATVQARLEALKKSPRFAAGALAAGRWLVGAMGAADFATHLCKIAHFRTRWPHDHGFAFLAARLRSLGDSRSAAA